MPRSPVGLAAPLPEKWTLSDHLYDCDLNGETDTVIDRLCRVIELLVREAPTAVQRQVIDTLNEPD